MNVVCAFCVLKDQKDNDFLEKHVIIYEHMSTCLKSTRMLENFRSNRLDLDIHVIQRLKCPSINVKATKELCQLNKNARKVVCRMISELGEL